MKGSFNHGDCVEWINSKDGGFYEEGRGFVTDVNNALEKIHVKWVSGNHGWCFMDEIKHTDVVTRLGEISREA